MYGVEGVTLIPKEKARDDQEVPKSCLANIHIMFGWREMEEGRGVEFFLTFVIWFNF